MNDPSILAILISLLVFFICTPAISYCICSNKLNSSNYKIIISKNSTNYDENSSLV